jgi:hypothetical protein
MSDDAQSTSPPAQQPVRSRGHGDQLPRKLHRMIEALLTERSYADAAEATGVSLTTLQKWLKLPCFKQAFDDAKRRAVDHAVARLSALTQDAVAALQRSVSCGIPAVEARTANSILENARAMAQHREIEGRLAALEERLGQALSHQRNGRSAR